jgi:hypothetical protein
VFKTIPGKSNNIVGYVLSRVKCGPECSKSSCRNAIYCDIDGIREYTDAGGCGIDVLNKYIKRLPLLYIDRSSRDITPLKMLQSAVISDDMFILKHLYDQNTITDEMIRENRHLLKRATNCLRWLKCKQIISD